MTTYSEPIEAVPDPATAPVTKGIVLTKAAAVYDLLSPAMLFWQEQPINRRATQYIDLSPSDLVLDVGCATGGMTLASASHLDRTKGGFAVGLDASIEMVNVARGKARDLPCRFDIGLAERLPYADETFDVYTSTFFFHHLALDDKLKALQEGMRVLKPGGRCCIVDVAPPTNLIGKISAHGGIWLFKQPEIAENVEGKLPPLFAEAGFSKIRQVAHNLGYISTYLMEKDK